MNYPAIDKAARAFIKSLHIDNALRPASDNKETCAYGLVSYALGGAVDVTGLVKTLRTELGAKPNESHNEKRGVLFYSWTSRRTGNRITLISIQKDDMPEPSVSILLHDPHYQPAFRRKPAANVEDAIHKAGQISMY